MENQKATSSSRGWRILRRLLIGVAVIVTLIGLFYAEEDVRGHFAWAAAQRECAAQGIGLNPHALEPAPVPDDQNFAMTPFLSPLLDFNPKPLKPGQSAWRDTNAFQQTVDFAKDFWKAYDSERTRFDRVENPALDLIGMAKAQHKQAKTAVPDYSTRAAAAADVLAYLQPYAPVLDELRAARTRPYSRFNVSYNDADPTGILLPHLAVVKKAVVILTWRASAELALGKNNDAFADVHLSLSLADSLHGEPFMISHLVRIAMLAATHRVIWEGLNSRAWSDQQLAELQAQLGKITILADASLGMRYELAAHGITLFEYLRHGPAREVANNMGMNGATFPLQIIPAGWLRLEQTSFVRLYSEMIQNSYDPQTGMIHPKSIKAFQQSISKDLGSGASAIWHHRVIARLIIPSGGNYMQNSAFSQTLVNEAVVACALERYRRVHGGQFPGALEALAPQFLAAIPTDVINGGALKYEPTGASQFKLYSVGWNETDDNGKIVLNDRSRTPSEGDWAWEPYN